MMSQRALTLVEVLTVLVLVAALGTLIGADRASVAQRARGLATRLSLLKMSAILGQPTSCAANELTDLLSLDPSVSWPPHGLLFTPDGLPRTCDGGGVGNTTILLEHRGRQAAVIVSSLGRVRWELR